MLRAIEVARLVLRRGYKRHELPRNPTEILTANVDQKTRGIYTQAEIDSLWKPDVWETGDFSPWEDAYDYTAFLLALCTGMRKGEILALDWGEVDLKRGVVGIAGAMRSDGSIGPTKGKRPRHTPIFDFVI